MIQEVGAENVEWDPALTPGSAGEKAAAAAVKHSCQERQLEHSKPGGTRTAPCGKGVNRARGAAIPPNGLILLQG